MSDPRCIEIRISIPQDELEDEELDEISRDLFAQIRTIDEIEDVNFLQEENPPDGSMSVSGFLLGQLIAVVKASNVKPFLSFLHERFGNREIELEIESSSQKLRIKVGSQQDLLKVIEVATKFVNEVQ